MKSHRTLCTFQLAGQWFGIEVGSVQEVLRHQPVTALRWANAAVQGLLNLRGQIVTAVDLRRGLGLPDRPEGQAPVNVVVRIPGRTGSAPVMSLWVDEVGDVVDVDAADFEATPPTLRGVSREFVRGVYKQSDHLLLALDLPRVVSAVMT